MQPDTTGWRETSSPQYVSPLLLYGGFNEFLDTSLKNSGEHTVPDVVQKMQARLLKKIAVEVAKLETAIAAQVKATPHFAELAEIIESVPDVGEITSAGLIATMPELGQVNDNIVAALLGVAPYDDDSGQRRGNRHIKGGRLIAKGKAAEGCAHRLYAQAHRHPQHHDRATPKMGRQPLQSERPRSASAERMPSLKTGERMGSRPSAAGGGGVQRQP